MSTPDFDNVSIAPDDYRYYVKVASNVVGSVIEPLSADSDYNTLPARAVLWDSVAKYWSDFETASIAAKYPAAFDPSPWTGDYQNLYEIEDQFPVQWDSTVYDATTSLVFPKGFLRPDVPDVSFDFVPYDPPLDLEIPDIEAPEPLMPAIIFPDIEGGGKLGRISVDTDMCIDTRVSYSSDSKSVTIHLDWETPPPSTGMWAFIVNNGSCGWMKINVCQN